MEKEFGKLVDSSFDEMLGSSYELYAFRFSHLQQEVKSWYIDVDIKAFDNRNEYLHHGGTRDSIYTIMKFSGVVSNNFYAYRDQNGKMYLMDGYNRLLTSYGNLPFDTTVYLKVLTSKIPDNKLMSIMFILNMWKLSNSGNGDTTFKVKNYLDRGFRLFMKSVFKLEITKHNMYALDKYFREESIADYYNYDLDELYILFKSEKVIDDFKEIVRVSNLEEKPFNNFDTFKDGFGRFLSRRRLKGDVSDHKFEDYLDKLKSDKLFKKLPTMSGNDSTRKNVYEFFRNIEKSLVITN
jgi:hypothetical protein